jgi:uncharacterized Zn finger protein
MSYWGWKQYVPVAERRRKAEAATAKARKSGARLSPVVPSRGAIAKTFWGKAWCENLERYSDYSNRLPRGRTYVRNGSVIDLVIGQGEIRAQVIGSSLYRVEVRVAAVGEQRWRGIGTDCVGSIDSMVELLQGTFSKAVMQRLCRPGDGLFPAPKEIEFRCTCPDWASMCKHVAAVLYGVGARLDQQPELLFQLRRVDGSDLLAQAGKGVMKPTKSSVRARVLDASDLGDVFGIEIADGGTGGEVVRSAAGRGRKGAAGAARAASKVVAGVSTKRASAADAGGKGKRSADTTKAPAAVVARTSGRTSREVGDKEKLRMSAGAKRGKAGTLVRAKAVPKRKRSHRE